MFRVGVYLLYGQVGERETKQVVAIVRTSEEEIMKTSQPWTRFCLVFFFAACGLGWHKSDLYLEDVASL